MTAFWKNLAWASLGCAAAAGLGARFTSSSVQSSWYKRLNKPGWQPPAAAFAPVWTLLYGAMAVSAAALWSSRGLGRRNMPAKALFVGQLVLNAGWSGAFFGLRSPRAGLAFIAPLLAAIDLYMVTAWRSSRVASLLFLPYSLWVSFATALNGWIAANN